MAARRVGTDGFEVECIVLNGRPTMRVCQLGYVVAYVHSVRELAAIVALEDLVEVVSLPRR
ncbi:hypothetical protein Ssi03_74350 [Sphaerisporangium siamense]|uniref:Transposase n=1 Tax=Sphaerisporangium siamense TaxID=795645 RepID=A0A7W7D8P0_9ACTN|nr:hypothetical protein [Sphaerisporangium siamense]MBB4702287.1 hypothetical protein [Sphaerisporangium siamense]GII89445.1 hypothetical protein Ssi03_74350 [Sphaerisporangium siamense]